MANETETEPADQPAQPVQMDWGKFGAKLEVPASNFKPTNPVANPNPCVRLHGFYEGNPATEVKCKTCKKLVCYETASRYYKCLLRKITNGPATDHYEAVEPDAEPEKPAEKRGVRVVRKKKEKAD